MQEQERYGYVYKITNNINGKIYVGQKKSPTVVEAYWGSGRIITQSIKKNGLANFSREILEWCNSKEQLDNREIYWIQTLNAMDSRIGYNLCDGGTGVTGLSGEAHPNYGRKVSEATRRRLSISHIGLQVGSKNGRYGKHCSEQQKQLLREANVGKPQSLETRLKRSASLKGHTTSPETRAKISASNKGKSFSEERKQRIREAMKDVRYSLVCQTCGNEFISKAPSRKYCDNCMEI